MRIKRYKVSGTGAHETSDGRWVKYDDHIAEVEKLEQAVEFYRGASRNPHDIARINELEDDVRYLHSQIILTLTLPSMRNDYIDYNECQKIVNKLEKCDD